MAQTEYNAATTKAGKGRGGFTVGTTGDGDNPYVHETNGTVIGPAGGGASTNTFTGATLLLGRIPINGKKVLVTLTSNALAGITGHAAATATLTFNTTVTDSASITLIDSIGTSKTFYARVAAVVTPRSDEFEFGASGTATATNFKALVNHATNGCPNITATGTGAAVTLTQDIKGAVGNTTISHSTSPDWDTITSSNVGAKFASGADVDFFCEFSPTGVNASAGPTVLSQWSSFTAQAADVVGNTTGILLASNITFANDTTLAYELDLTGVTSPYIRLGINSQGLTLASETSVTIGIAYPSAYVRSVDRETWNAKGEREQ